MQTLGTVRIFGALPVQIQMAALWLMLASSWFVIVEPAPADLLFILFLATFVLTGVTVSALIVPLAALLLLYNLGGFVSFLEVADDRKAAMFVVTSVYMAATAVIFALHVVADPLPRMANFRQAYILAGVIAALIGIATYFDIGGTAAAYSPIGRAQGTFKDPNVLSTFLIFPALAIMQSFMLGTARHRLAGGAALLVMVAAIFLAFSRGAWLNFVLASTLLAGLTFMLSPQPWLRSRIVLIAMAGAIVSAALVAVLLSFENVHALFVDRLTLIKDYDAGERGRFGNQLNSISMLLDHPQGFGPTLYRQIFGMDPHNVYLNAFSSYGWLGGISYFVLILSTITIGLKACLTRSPLQSWSLLVFCPLVAMILQGIQIDTDHWRHFYWMLGLMWGLYAATVSAGVRRQVS